MNPRAGARPMPGPVPSLRGSMARVLVPVDFYDRFPQKSLPFLVSEKGEAVQRFRWGSMKTVDAA